MPSGITLARSGSRKAFSESAIEERHSVSEFVEVASIGEIAPGQMMPIEAQGVKLLLARVGDTYFATQRKCPHLGFNLCRGKIEAQAVVCPLHKAKFDLVTGAIERDPRLFFIGMKAKSNLATYPTKTEDGAVWVAI
jgi:nitrite reductase/ring-hydroxylating ferredoxin subunit